MTLHVFAGASRALRTARELPRSLEWRRSSVWTTSFSSFGSSTPFSFSESRLQQFLEAEVSHFAAMKRTPLTLKDLLSAAESPRRAALLVHDEIPKHFAARLRQIEGLENWREDEYLLDLHSRYSESFQEMRLIEVEHDLTSFTDVVRKLKERQRQALPLLGKALWRRRESVVGSDNKFWQEWMNRFLKSRISTEMLTSQYIAIINQSRQNQTAITGIVDPVCDPAAICENAAEAAKHICRTNMGIAPEVEIDVRVKRDRFASFSYIPIYLHYIVLEALKNSCHATAQASFLSSSVADPEMAADSRPVHVVICSDDKHVAIRISDRAGGIPFEIIDRVWDYAFTGSSEGYADPEKATVLAGYGMGLPLARLYAEYLGGNLSLMSLPEYGVDTYLYLPRIDIKSFER